MKYASPAGNAKDKAFSASSNPVFRWLHAPASAAAKSMFTRLRMIRLGSARMARTYHSLRRHGYNLPAGHMIQMARRHVPLAHRPQHRFLHTAAIEREGAARVETAAARRIDRAWHIACQDNPVTL